MDPMTGRSRGFAFLLYKGEAGVDEATKAPNEHKVKGKAITVKKADVKQGKIYVGKLPEAGCEVEDIQAHFQQFGAVAEVSGGIATLIIIITTTLITITTISTSR